MDEGRARFGRRYWGVALVVLVFGGGAWVRLGRAQTGALGESGPLASSGLPPDFRFNEVGAAMGINFRYQDPVLDPMFDGKERLFFWGTGAAVADVDGDGWMDVLLLSAKRGEKNHLYLSDHGRAFRERAADWGVADNDPRAVRTSAVFFDYDNDGRPDLYLAGIGCTQLFRNTGSRFEDVSRASGIRDCNNSIGAVPFDLDEDGRLDLYVLRYWSEVDLLAPPTSRIWPENHFNALNGGRKTIYRNRGDGTFEDITERMSTNDTHWTLDAAWGDLTGSGEMNLYLANDFGADVLYAGEGGKLVDKSSQSFAAPDRRFGMGASLGDLTGDGTPNLLVTNEFVDGYDQTGNFLWHLDREGVGKDEAVQRRVDNCGWAWGSVFADLDLDGREDLFVANGFITGPQGAPDYLRVHYGAFRQDYAFTVGTMMSSPGIVAMDVRNWPSPKEFSYAGHQTDCVFWNRGDSFVNVAHEVGVADGDDGRAVAAIDLENDGSMDLLVTTQNGAPHLYKNQLQPRGRWIGFALVGTRSNRDAVGARVEVRQGSRRWYRWATGGKSGFLASSDPRLHFGIPEGGTVDVRVRWPSGLVQEQTGLATGRYHTITEKP
jgi:enediyne biosynthesis protein E4